MNTLKFDQDGLIPGIVQHADTGEVLMLAYLNQASLDLTRSTGEVHFWSRSRGRLWKKGETSGNTLAMVDLQADCDGDTLLITARPAGPVCHTGTRTCFVGAGSADPQGFGRLESLWRTIDARNAARPAGSYTTALLEAGVDGPGRKVIEEAAEVVLAAAEHDRRGAPAVRISEEAADLLYHLLVLLAERGLNPAAVLDVLDHRSGPPSSG